METEQLKSSSAVTFEKASFIALVATIVLGVLAFAPGMFLSLAATKTFIIGLGVFISVIFFILSKIKSKSFNLTLHPFIWIAAAAALVVLLSALLSPNVASSFFGKSFSADTGAFLLTLFIAGALSFGLTKGRANLTFWIFSAILGSFSILALFHITRFFGGVNFLSFGIFTSIVYTVIGTWHDLGIFAGLALILSLVTLQLLPMSNKVVRALFITSFVLASVILVVVDLQSVWIIVAIAALAFGVYKYIINRGAVGGKWHAGMPVFAIIVTVIALVLAWSPGFIGTFMGNTIVAKAGASYTEVELPWNLTTTIGESTVKASPVFGAGPARFVNQYLKYKPEVINATPFWSTDFSNGNSYILTALVTEGTAGFIVWLALAVAFFWFGGRSLIRMGASPENQFSRYGLAASYFGAGLVWLAMFDYVPQHAILLVLFVLTGVCAAHFVSVPGKRIDFSSGSSRIPSVVILWIVIAFSAVAIVYTLKSTIAEAYFETGVQSLNNGGALSATAQKIQTALKLNKSDVYYQAIAQMDVFAVSQIVTNATTTPSQQTIQLIGGLINDGINSSRLAQQFDLTNPYNYLSEAQVAVTAAEIGEAGAYADATSSYQKAITLDPYDPSIYLGAAKLEFFEKNDAGAKNYLNVALELKPDYTDAIFEAGVISYTDKDYATAVSAFTEVQKLQSTYPDIQAAISLAQAAAKGGQLAADSQTTPPTTSIVSAASSTAARTSTTTKPQPKK